MGFSTSTCTEFVEVLASKAPVPGGGGASALVGAVGTALGNMVGSLTVGKKKYADVEDEMYELKAKCDQLQKDFLRLIERDAEVFEPLSKAYGMPKETEEEKAEKARPEIKITVDNLDEYDTIYIGYPIWWGTMPMAMFTFIENNNLDGKTIIPFSTHKGSGLGSSVSDLKTALHNSTIKDGLACNSSTTTAQIKNWIENSEK